MLMHPLQKLRHAWSNQYKDIAYATFDLNWEDDIRIFNRLER
jgi:hypothetical protein